MSVLSEIFGKATRLKVIDFFLTFREFDYSKTQVAAETEISRITVDKIWPRLIKAQIISPTRTMGAAELYKLNLHNPRVKALIEMDMKISGAAARENLEVAAH